MLAGQLSFFSPPGFFSIKDFRILRTTEWWPKPFSPIPAKKSMQLVPRKKTQTIAVALVSWAEHPLLQSLSWARHSARGSWPHPTTVSQNQDPLAYESLLRRKTKLFGNIWFWIDSAGNCVLYKGHFHWDAQVLLIGHATLLFQPADHGACFCHFEALHPHR